LLNNPLSKLDSKKIKLFLHLNKFLQMKNTIKILGLFVFLAQFISCDKDGYTINGTIDNKDIKQVYLQVSKDGKRPSNIDTAAVVDGKFIFTGKADKPEIAFLAIDKNPQKARFFLENANLKLTVYKDSLGKSKVNGGLVNKSFTKFLGETEKINAPIKKLSDTYQNAVKAKDSSKIAQIKTQFGATQKDVQKKQIAYYQKFIKENSKSYFSYILLRDLSKGNALKGDVALGLFNGLNKKIKNSEEGIALQKTLQEKVNNVPMVKQSMTMGYEVKDFSAPNPSGKKIALYSVKGKYTLVDFWASWCGPCRKENPNVVAAYKKYHDKGFNIIGVSLDKDKARWEAAIAKDGLDWAQISNLKFWSEPIAQSFGIRSIPQNFLMDENNKIIAINLRGPALQEKLAELFK
jgi:thiol-disulfide isomerase/thioredoxin